MLLEDLIDIGLTEKEAKVYLALMKHGSHPISYIAKKAELNRGTTYQALHTLLDLGLVAKSMKKNVQIFSPLDPSRIQIYLQHQAAEMEQKKEEAIDVIAELERIASKETTRPRVEYFDGIEGARKVLMDTIAAKDTMLYSYLSIYDVHEYLGRKFFAEYTSQRIEKGYSLRTIRTLEKDRTALSLDTYLQYYGASEELRREVRHLGDDMAFPITMYMYDDKVALVSSKDENFGLTITSQEFSSMQKRIFEMLWERLDPPKEKAR